MSEQKSLQGPRRMGSRSYENREATARGRYTDLDRAIAQANHDFPVNKKHMVELWRTNLIRFVEKNTMSHHWVEKALIVTDAAATQMQYDHSTANKMDKVYEPMPDQPVRCQWAGTGQQEITFIGGESWPIGCPQSVKYRAIMQQLNEHAIEWNMPRESVTCAMLEDHRWREVFNHFVNSTCAMFGMDIMECVKWVRDVSFREPGCSAETPVAFLYRYKARCSTVQQIVRNRIRYSLETGIGTEEHMLSQHAEQLMNGRTVLEHLQYMDIGTGPMHDVLKKINCLASFSLEITC